MLKFGITHYIYNTMNIYEYTAKEIKKVVEGYVISFEPLVFKEIPAKEKRKYLLLCMIVHYIEKDIVYTEKALNELLKPIVSDYAMIRRYLVDYGFIDRKTDGSAYWLVKDPKDYEQFNIRHWMS